MTSTERIEKFIKFKGLCKHKFELEIGLSNGYIHNLIKKNSSVGTGILNKIHKYYPELNVLWVITGEGQMLNFAYA